MGGGIQDRLRELERELFQMNRRVGVIEDWREQQQQQHRENKRVLYSVLVASFATLLTMWAHQLGLIK